MQKKEESITLLSPLKSYNRAAFARLFTFAAARTQGGVYYGKIVFELNRARRASLNAHTAGDTGNLARLYNRNALIAV